MRTVKAVLCESLHSLGSPKHWHVTGLPGIDAIQVAPSNGEGYRFIILGEVRGRKGPVMFMGDWHDIVTGDTREPTVQQVLVEAYCFWVSNSKMGRVAGDDSEGE